MHAQLKISTGVFRSSSILQTPMIPMVLEAWNLKDRHPKNLLFLTYEEMKLDLDPVLAKLASFLGVKDSISPDQMETLKREVSFESLQV